MRVTNYIFFQSSMRNVQKAFSEMEEINARTASGLAVEKPSDNPVAAAEILATSRDLRATEQYTRNIEDGERRLQTEETVLNSMTDILGRARELAVSEAGSTGDSVSRAATKLEVDQLFDATVNHGNTFVSGIYIFGGNYTDLKPFDATGSVSPTQPPQGQHELEIAAAETAETNHDGQEVFVDSGVFTSITSLSTALGADDSAGIQSALGELDLAFDHVQGLLTEVGARTNRMDRAKQHFEIQQFTLIEMRSDLQDVDFAETALEFANQQTVLQSALLATSRAMSLTLTEYLR